MRDAMSAFQEIEIRNSREYRKYEAWYVGDENKLRDTSDDGKFWRNNKQCSRKVHMPIAAEIAAVSSDLLFAEPPSIEIIGEAEQQRLDIILSTNEINSKLYTAGELCAAFGDVYLKVNWDDSVADVPLINMVHPMLAYPEYERDVLQGVHFFSCTRVNENDWTWVHEYYGKGFIHTDIGSGFEYAPSGFYENYTKETEIDSLLAVHIKNMAPRRNNFDMNRGRSDYEGVINVMDALDEAYSSWMRDVNLGKARLIVPADYFRHRDHVDPLDPHQKVVYFDKDDEVFLSMDIDPAYANGTGIVEAQFAIRDEEHKRTCDNLLERIITSAGYSPQTFGLSISGRAESGTALNIRERKTYTTKAKKELFWRKQLEQLLKDVIKVDEVVFENKYESENIVVDFKEPAQDLNNIADALNKLSTAGGISVYEMVKRVNPDWDDKQIQEEVDYIRADKGMLIDNDFDVITTEIGADYEPRAES